MSTREEQIALLNTEKQENLEAIDLLNTQLKDLDQAIINTNATIDQYNIQIELYKSHIDTLNTKNTTLDDIIIEIGG